MKIPRFILLIIAFSSLIPCRVISPYVYCSENPLKHTELSDFLPDTLAYRYQNHPYILFHIGHYGYSWSLIVKINDKFHIHNGKVSYTGDKLIDETNNTHSFDSAKFISSNRYIINWAIDSLHWQSVGMTPQYPAEYLPISSSLEIHTKNNASIFNSDNAIGYRGPDSIGFNNRFHHICLLMRWLAIPELRQYIPESNIYDIPGK